MSGGDAGPWVMLALLGAYHGINPGMGWLFAVALGLQERSRQAVIRAFAPIALGHAVSIAAVVLLVAALQTVVSPMLLRMVGAGLLVAYGLYKLLAPMSHPRWVGMRVGFRDLTVWSFLMATAHGAGLMLVPILLKLPGGEMATPPPIAAVSAPASQTAHGATHAAPSGDTVKPAEHGGAASEPSGMTGMTHEGHEHMHPSGGHDDHSGHDGTATPAARETGEHAQHLQAMKGSSPLAAIAAVLLHTGAMFLTMALIAVIVYEKVGLAILRKAWFNLDLLWAIALIGAGVVTFFL